MVMYQNRIPPVQVGMEYSAKIINTGKDGSGVCRVSGFVLFVREAAHEIGHHVRIRVTVVRDRYGFAELIDNRGTAQLDREP